MFWVVGIIVVISLWGIFESTSSLESMRTMVPYVLIFGILVICHPVFIFIQTENDEYEGILIREGYLEVNLKNELVKTKKFKDIIRLDNED